MTAGQSQLERHLALERGAILRLVDRGVLPAQRVAAGLIIPPRFS